MNFPLNVMLFLALGGTGKKFNLIRCGEQGNFLVFGAETLKKDFLYGIFFITLS